MLLLALEFHLISIFSRKISRIRASIQDGTRGDPCFMRIFNTPRLVGSLKVVVKENEDATERRKKGTIVAALCAATERKKTPVLPPRRSPSSPPSVAATTVAAACRRAVIGFPIEEEVNKVKELIRRTISNCCLIFYASLIEKQALSSESVVDPNCDLCFEQFGDRVELGEGGLVAPSQKPLFAGKLQSNKGCALKWLGLLDCACDDMLPLCVIICYR
ncbi:hypothetical protein PIB30_003599 [Stylosanthes scabra]|uniref:Uncharacterized protein n=1 Tax=Stylosanthes scabra TaxID=79078 RepID=A0ABU6Y1P9_9FABA|nr:hypothetical protein [Stylosanthes scabra]